MIGDIIDAIVLLFKLVLTLIELIFDLAWRFIGLFIQTRPQKSLKNEIVLVTGAASGIGQLMAYKFSKQGAKLVVCWDLNEKGNQETAKNINSFGGRAIAFKCNLADRKDVYRAADETKAAVKKCLNDPNATVSILVNNAGIVTGRSILHCKDELMQLTMDVNTTAHFWTIKAFMPDMLEKNHGHIVTIASGAGLGGIAGLLDYCASKFGAVGLSESLLMEVNNLKKDINVTCICPYFISTGMFEGVKNRYPWLLPILDPNEMAEIIVDATRRNIAFVIRPQVVYLLHYLKPLMGARMYLKFCELFELHASMDEFVGRNK